LVTESPRLEQLRGSKVSHSINSRVHNIDKTISPREGILEKTGFSRNFLK